MADKFLTVEQAAKKAGDVNFYQNVKRAVIPRLIKKKLLTGKKDGKTQFVADDEALARIMRLGIEPFVYNQQGYSFVVVLAPLDQVAAHLETRPSIIKYQANIKPRKLGKDAGVEPDEFCRHTYLLQMRETPEWTIWLQTVHWFQSCDAIMGTALAAALSQELGVLAGAAWDDDFSGSSLIVCENGEQTAKISDSGKWEKFYEFFYEQGILIPEAFISFTKGKAELLVADPAAVERADYAELKLPSPNAGKVPHVLEKLGMMAEAIAEDLDDEEAFMEHMHGGIWEQAQALLAAGVI
jgi:hypothetical protein